jgi:hypothetical protein
LGVCRRHQQPCWSGIGRLSHSSLTSVGNELPCSHIAYDGYRGRQRTTTFCQIGSARTGVETRQGKPPEKGDRDSSWSRSGAGANPCGGAVAQGSSMRLYRCADRSTYLGPGISVVACYNNGIRDVVCVNGLEGDTRVVSLDEGGAQHGQRHSRERHVVGPLPESISCKRG